MTQADVTIPMKIEGVEVQFIADENGARMNIQVDGMGEYCVSLTPTVGGQMELNANRHSDGLVVVATTLEID